MNKWTLLLVLISISCVACDPSESPSVSDEMGIAGSSGVAGAAGQAGSGFGGSAGATEQDAGQEDADAAGFGGNAGSAGSAGGSGGAAGAASTDCDNVSISIKPGFDTPPDSIITPPVPMGNGVGFEILLDSPASSEPLKVVAATICQIDPNGDVADFTKVTMNWAAQEFAFANVPDGNCWKLTPSWYDFVLPAGLGRLVWIGASVAEPVSSAAANNAMHGVPRAGHTPVLQLKSMTVSRLDGSYSTTVNSVLKSSRMVVRKSSIVALAQPVNSVLANGDQELAKLNVFTPGAAVEQKMMAFKLTRSQSVVIQNIRALCNGQEMDQQSYAVYASCSDSSCSNVVDGKLVYVLFKNEVIPSLTQRNYSLIATVAGVQAGEWVQLDLDRASSSNPATGRLLNMGGPIPILAPDPFYPGQPDPNFVGTFLWSDMSEVPHGNSSLDWTNDLWLQMGNASWKLES